MIQSLAKVYTTCYVCILDPGWPAVAAPNAAQAVAYESQLKLRQELGLLAGVNEVRLVADPPQQTPKNRSG